MKKLKVALFADVMQDNLDGVTRTLANIFYDTPEEIDIRLYSIIYDAINELKDAMEGMLSPEIKEEIVATLEVQETFKITKVGTITDVSRGIKLKMINGSKEQLNIQGYEHFTS